MCCVPSTLGNRFLILLFTTGDLLSHQPTCRYLSGGPRGESVAERHRPLRRAVHQDLRHQQGAPALRLSVLPFPCPHLYRVCFCFTLSRFSPERSEGAQSSQADVPTLGAVPDAICVGCQVRAEYFTQEEQTNCLTVGARGDMSALLPGKCSKMLRAVWTWTGSSLLSTARTATRSPRMTSSSCWPTSGSELAAASAPSTPSTPCSALTSHRPGSCLFVCQT